MPHAFRSLSRYATAAVLLLTTPALELRAQTISPQIERVAIANQRSGATAMLLSLASTVVPVMMASGIGSRNGNVSTGIGVAGMVLGPAAGHFYAGNPRHALIGIGLRGATLGATIVLVNAQCGKRGELCGLETALVGSLGIAVSGIIDIATAPASAKAFNKAHAEVVIRPIQAGDQTRLGIGMSVAF